jgi:hypothetical protein
LLLGVSAGHYGDGYVGDALSNSTTPLNFAIEHETEREALPAHPDLRRLLEYWRGKCGERPFPRREDIDPVDFRFMLDRIALTEVHGDPPRRYRMRLVGTFWRDLSGVELSGTWVEDLPTANLRDLTIGFYEAMIAARKPRFAVRDAIIDDRLLRYEIMLLPLSEDGNRISMILTGIGRGNGQY